MGERQGRRERLGEEVRSHLSSGDIDQGDDAIRHESADVVVADVDVARFAGDLGGFGKLDGRTVVFQDDSGASWGKP